MNGADARQYELVYVLQPQLDENGLNSVDGRVCDIITAQGGSDIATEVWGKRTLAYPINRFYEGSLHLASLSDAAIRHRRGGPHVALQRRCVALSPDAHGQLRQRDEERIETMSEQTNPTPEMETETAESGAVGEVEVTQSRPAQPPVYVEDVADVNEEDEAYEEELDDEDEEESFRAPDQYVEREGSGRPRRIGSDVRYDEIEYKNIGLLSRFLDRRGRILSRRKTRVSAKVQRKIVREIKRARHLALLPYTADQTRIVRKRK